MIWVLRKIIFVGGKYLVMKASLHLSQESILLWGKEKNKFLHDLAKKIEMNFNFTISLSTSVFFCISHNYTNALRWDAASSLGVPENWSFITRFNKAALISQDSALVTEGAIGVLIKSLLLILEKTHNFVFFWDIATMQQECKQKQIWRQKGKTKGGRIKQQTFVKWGRWKWEANGK